MVELFTYLNVISCFLMTVSTATPPKSVNLAVETSFLFDPQEMQQNSTILTNARRFLDKLENLLSPKKKAPYFKTRETAETRPKALTDFLTEFGIILINSSNEDVASMTAALNDIVQKNYASNPKFHELFKDLKLKTYVVNSAREWADTDPMLLKVEIAKNILNSKTDTSELASFFSKLNFFFESEKDTLKKLTKHVARATKNKQFSKPIANILKYILDGYDSLSDFYKSILHKELDKLTQYGVKNVGHRLLNTGIFRKSMNYNSTVNDLSESSREDFKSSGNSFENNSNTENNNNEITIDKDILIEVSGTKEEEKATKIQN